MTRDPSSGRGLVYCRAISYFAGMFRYISGQPTMMLEAGTSILRQLHPNHYHIYDAHGRLLRMVVACNPETGEVIRYDTTDNGKAIATNADGSPRMRHGFWPAPLRVVPLGGPAPAGVPYRVGDGAREKRIDITAAEIIARARAKEQRVEIINRITAATGKTVTRKLTVADLDELIDKVEDGAREQRVGIPNGGAGIAYLDELIDNAGGGE